MTKIKKIAIIQLPKFNTPVQEGFNNLNGYWTPPPCVLEHWAGACKVMYYEDSQFIQVKGIVMDSYHTCINQFYRENAL